MTGARLPARALTRTELLTIDCSAAMLLTAVYLAPLGPLHPSGRSVWWGHGPILLMIAVPVALRRVWPLSVFGFVAAASTLALLLGVLPDPFVATALTAYTAATTRRPGRRGWWTIFPVSAVLAVVSVSAGSATPRSDALRALVPGAALVGAVWTLGIAVRERRVSGEREIEARLSRVVLDERLRLARDVHDIVTHNLGVIAVKAAVARHVAHVQPAEALAALVAIEKVSRAALADMRQALCVLRADPQGQERDSADDRPYVIADIQSLVRRAGEAGLDIHCDLPDTDDVPAAVSRSAYRIVQEALTNVMKHAGPTRCDVTMCCDAKVLTIEVRNDAPEAGWPTARRSAAPTGYGLLGIWERVTMHGGEVVAAGRDRGGYRLSVRLPFGLGEPPDGR